MFPALPLEVNPLNKSQTMTAQRTDVDVDIEKRLKYSSPVHSIVTSGWSLKAMAAPDLVMGNYF